MGRYIVRRLLMMIPVLIGTTFFIYAMAWAIPGDPFASRCGQRPCTDAFIQAETERLHLDEALPIQYLHFLWNMLQGDFGTTSTGSTVLEEASAAFPITVKLTVVAILFEIFLGIGLGIAAALRKGGYLDGFFLFSSLVAISFPAFVIGYVLQYVLGVKAGLFSVTVGYGAPWGDLILPGFVLACLSLAYVLRLTRASLLETLKADHVRTAIAKGLPRGMVLRKHVIRNSLIPVITYIGADVGILLGGAIVTEGVFNIQGLGGLLYHALRIRENATVVSVTTLVVLVILLVNLLVDLLYARLDPRIRYE
ncbi:ABC transporter permease [Kineosporia rhizophila]|uniref:ABC transporter permease n=1 Tax=Kineosporia TaxID=49184 RepID=UPI000AA9D94D|nr:MULTISPECIES: ABC transporter permease [Kineosporia]MCE0534978.1 ABC transporter permease [Kineosporia rhizophila]GLY14740.1 ABC transporter permease [Kineosporia sp. NBRC 101677]